MRATPSHLRFVLGAVLAGLAGLGVVGARGGGPRPGVSRDAVAPEGATTPATPNAELALVRSSSNASRARIEDVATATETVAAVHVVDALGRPAVDVPLVVGRRTAGRGAFEPLARARTDDEGNAAFARDVVPERADLVVRAEIVATPLPEVALSADAAEPAQLGLPPAGVVRLAMEDASGAVLEVPGRFGVSLPVARGADELVLPRWTAAPRGNATLGWVALDLELAVVASVEGGNFEEGWARVAGPARDGEVVTVRVPLGPRVATVALRAVDAAGLPLVGAALAAELAWRGPSTGGALRSSMHDVSVPLVTDVVGRASLPVRGRVTGGYACTLTVVDGHDRASAPIDLTAGLGEGKRIDVGDVVLAPRAEDRLWVAGRVEDERGVPVAGATVLATASSPGAERAARHAVAGADGSFRVVGPAVTGDVDLRALAPGFLDGPSESARLGADDVRLRLRPSASWSGRLELDAGIPPDALALVLRSAGSTRTCRVDANTVVVRGLAPGPVDVEVRIREGGWLLEQRAGCLTRTDGEGAEDVLPADVFDLRGRLEVLDLRLRDPDGAPLARARTRVTPEPWPAGDVWTRDGALRVVVPAGARRIEVRPRGLRGVEVEPLARVQDIVCGH